MQPQDDDKEWRMRVDQLPEPEEKVIFLDFDGVLNSVDFLEETYDQRKLLEKGRRTDQESWWSAMIDGRAVGHLNEIIKHSGAKVVVSSSWRHGHTLAELRGILKNKGFIGSLIDKTPKRAPVAPYRRGNEIQAWLDEHPDVKKFVIIDDDSDMEHLMSYLVQTTWKSGLLAEHVAKALRILE